MTLMNSSGRREVASTILAILVGGGGIVFGSSRSWLSVTEPRLAPFGPLQVSLSGRNLYPALNGLAIVALIIAVLVLVTAGWARRLLGALLLVLSVSAAWYSVRGSQVPSTERIRELLAGKLGQQAGALQVQAHPAAAWLSVGCSILLVLASISLIVRGGRWQVALSAKYSAPVEVAKSGDPWRRLDRGEDPTISDD